MAIKRSTIIGLWTTSAVLAFADPSIIGANGSTGYIDMPSALLPAEGETNITYFRSDLGSGQHFQFQASENLSLGVDFADYEGFDKENSLDIKYQVYHGKNWIPSIAIGANDVLGIGPRSSEYIVATSQVTRNIEATVGMGWGAMGNFDPSVDSGSRPSIDQHVVSTDHYFKGPSAPFAGLNYRTPIKGLSLSVEYSSMAWADAVANGFERDDLSYGVQYRPNDNFSLRAFSRNGDDIGFALTLSGNPSKPIALQQSTKAPATVIPRAALRTDMSNDWAQDTTMRKLVAQQLAKSLTEEGFKVTAVRATTSEIAVEIKDGGTKYTPKIFGRIARQLAMTAPGSVENFSVSIINDANLPTSVTKINRTDLEQQAGLYDASAKSFASTEIEGARPLKGEDVYRTDFKEKPYSFGGDINVASVENDDGTSLRISPSIKAKYKTTFGLSVSTKLSMNLNRSDAALKASDIGIAVRSDESLYRQDFFTLDRLSADYKFKLGKDIYGRISGGLMQAAYAGLEGEMLYAPSGSRFAVGGRVAQVTKRDPENYFGLGEYKTTTGEVTGYWDTGYKGIELSASYGRFLAEDWGGSLKASRKFANGWEVAGSLTGSSYYQDSKDTRQLVPSISISIPLQWGWKGESSTVRSFPFGNSKTDAAQKLDYAESLYSDVRNYDLSDYEMRWGAYWQ